MEHVVVERAPDTRITLEDAVAAYEEGKWCLDLYRVTLLRSFVSRSGNRMACVYTAPDAESVRNTTQDPTFPVTGVWRSTLHGPGHRPQQPDLERVVVTRSFPEPPDFDEVQAREDAVGWCLDMHNVTFVETFFSLDRTRMLCLYDAPDAEAVRHANRESGIPFDDIWSCDLLIPHAD